MRLLNIDGLASTTQKDENVSCSLAPSALEEDTFSRKKAAQPSGEGEVLLIVLVVSWHKFL